MQWGDRFFEPSKPRKARGGIKAQSKRGGTFGQSWWAKRWISVLESMYVGARLGRGRSYARSGQVLSIDIVRGQVKARVQGSQRTPYSVTVSVVELSESDWEKVVEALSQQAIFTARLLAGEMPEEIEQAFDTAGVSLFPKNYRELKTRCSCPDASNPCKHIAAVYYLLGEEFDRDPFLIFKLRGLERETLFKRLGNTGSREKTRVNEAPALPPEPLDPTTLFWSGEEISANLFGEVRIPALDAALPRRLGHLPFWRSEERFADVMERLYRQASPAGMEVFLEGQAQTETFGEDEPPIKIEKPRRNSGRKKAV